MSRRTAPKPLPEVARVERDAFAATLRATEPDAPTCCAGWDVRDLCIHLVLFQRRPDAWFAVPVGARVRPLQRYYDGLVARERARPWLELVERFRAGPAYGPLARDAWRDAMFFREYVVHHEDVRRAAGLAPRSDIDDVQQAVWAKLPGFVRMVLPKDLGVTYTWPGRAQRDARAGEARVELSGEPVELLLHLFGRGDAARVTVGGTADSTRAAGIRDTSVLAALPRLAG
jgi:uncharacterized protein (TIGR03085 family)